MNSNDNNVFRFVHLRAAQADDDARDPNDAVVEREEDDRAKPKVLDRLLRKGSDLNESVDGRVPGKDSQGFDAESARLKIDDLWGVEEERLKLIVKAKRDVESLKPGRDLSATESNGDAELPFFVNSRGLEKLQPSTVEVFKRLAKSEEIKDSSVTSLFDILDTGLSDASFGVVNEWSYGQDPAKIPTIRAVGIADLLVVKQNILRYEASEIAHIENVLDGETKKRTHRDLDRIETIVSMDSETTTTKDTELAITERFELNKETSKTAQKDRQMGFGLSLSGRYGPSVEFSSEAELQQSSSSTTSTRNAVNYAKDIVERSRESVVERVRHQRQTTILQEVEETNVHKLKNDSGNHIVGMYQFVDKVYESQVFSYGLRQIFDFMIPEPASYLWHLERAPNPDIDLPVPPIRLESEAPDASYMDEDNYLRLGARYNVEGLKPPPSKYLAKRSGTTHGSGQDSEEGKPRSFSETDITIPSGYIPIYSELSVVLTSDETPAMVITIGHQMHVLKKADMTSVDLSQGNFKAYTRSSLITNFLDEQGEQIDDEKIRIHVFANETANYTTKVKITFERKEAAMRSWRIATYDAISTGYQNMVMQYQQELDEMKAKENFADRTIEDYGDPPAKNLRIVKQELKKHCLSVLRKEHPGVFHTSHSPGGGEAYPPWFNIADAMEDGKTVRFFENAFEWDQIQYATYPYFWSRRALWAARFRSRNMDPIFEEFLRAGSARVVVPVTPGFEAAVSYYLEKGEIWSGQGEPSVEDPLYKPIVEEIKERTGGGKGEIPVDDTWETRLPTAAVVLRQKDGLPKWRKVTGEDWKWEPDEEEQP